MNENNPQAPTQLLANGVNLLQLQALKWLYAQAQQKIASGVNMPGVAQSSGQVPPTNSVQSSLNNWLSANQAGVGAQQQQQQQPLYNNLSQWGADGIKQLYNHAQSASQTSLPLNFGQSQNSMPFNFGQSQSQPLQNNFPFNFGQSQSEQYPNTNTLYNIWQSEPQSQRQLQSPQSPLLSQPQSQWLPLPQSKSQLLPQPQSKSQLLPQPQSQLMPQQQSPLLPQPQSQSQSQLLPQPQPQSQLLPQPQPPKSPQQQQNFMGLVPQQQPFSGSQDQSGSYYPYGQAPYFGYMGNGPSMGYMPPGPQQQSLYPGTSDYSYMPSTYGQAYWDQQANANSLPIGDCPMQPRHVYVNGALYNAELVEPPVDFGPPPPFGPNNSLLETEEDSYDPMDAVSV